MNTMMMQAMQQLQALQHKVAQAQSELESMIVTENGGDGRVSVTVDGKGRLKTLALDPDYVRTGDTEFLEDLLLATINKALDASRAMSDAHLARATEGMMPNIPGLNLPL